ncbi:MAG: SDR family oxidoreductase [Planctomycetes bacterium]|nr:SDR family oxidoreductase [Planctomycetota bacterium]
MTSTPPVSLVTGSARGLGLAVARALLRRGDRVHVVWRSSRALVANLEREFEGRVHQADLEDPAAAHALVERVTATDGRLDHLVHAVGEYVSGPLEGARAADLRRMLASNVETAFHVFDAARPALRRARGDAVFFGCAGLDTLRARRETALYTAAKNALFVLARSWALEEAPHGVRVNLVSPGVVPHEHAAADTLDAERLARIPLGRAGTPDDVAHAVLFLASPAAAHVTGVDLAVTGGWLL